MAPHVRKPPATRGGLAIEVITDRVAHGEMLASALNVSFSVSHEQMAGRNAFLRVLNPPAASLPAKATKCSDL
jgi:hypothetical protein